jgi:hypothetical protein
MSVINKMLRDLDHRHAESTSASDGGAEPVASGLDVGPLRGGTSAIHWGASDAGVQPGSGSRLWFWVGSIGALVAAITGGWLWMQSQHANPTPTPIASKPAQTPTPSASAPAVEVAVQEESKPETTVAPTAMVLRMEESLSARRALDALLSSPTPTPKASTPPPTTSQTGASTFAVSAQKASASAATTGAPVPPVANSPRPASVVTKAPVAAPPVDAPAVVAQRQQLAGGEALAQAQGLWTNGSQDAAIELLQQAIAVAERAARASAADGPGPVLVPLVRELARMQLAQGRFGAVWEMLTRLESLLGNQADLWAIRANAAQRLGRHQDSVHAYMVALQARPDEQRWLLGTAVSLAALGQTSSAAEMAERARVVGPVSKEVVTYLRQAGVAVRE